MSQLIQSQDEEHKILINDYLNAQTNNGYTVKKSLSISSGYLENYLAQFAQGHPDWTIYFPMEEHYAAWIKNNGKTAPITACDPLIDEEYVESIIGYCENGTFCVLSAQTIPAEPTLIISSEPYLSDSVETYKEQRTEAVELHIHVLKFKLYNDQEPWYKGAPEIYIRAYINATTNSQYTSFDVSGRNVDKEKVWYPDYAGWNWVTWHGQICFAGICVFRYSYATCNPIRVMEDDWPDADDLVQDITLPVPIQTGTFELGTTFGAMLKLWISWQ
ncbi:MAG: hypothetical protein ACPL28_08150 [bacterium]